MLQLPCRIASGWWAALFYCCTAVKRTFLNHIIKSCYAIHSLENSLLVTTLLLFYEQVSLNVSFLHTNITDPAVCKKIRFCELDWLIYSFYNNLLLPQLLRFCGYWFHNGNAIWININIASCVFYKWTLTPPRDKFSPPALIGEVRHATSFSYPAFSNCIIL